MKKFTRWTYVAAAIAIIILLGFFFIGKDTIDPDFGWHYRLGDYIYHYGVMRTDLFSYTMTSYPFVDFEWLTNLFWYVSYPVIGMPGLSIFYALITLLSLFITVPSKFRKYAIVSGFCAFAVMMSRFGVRPQVIGWLMWGICIRFITDEVFWKKWKWVFPFCILFWVNVHGSFPIGIFGIGLFLGIRTIIQKKLIYSDWGVWLTGVFATLINPYGLYIWHEIFVLMSQTRLFVTTLAEWMPFYWRLDFGMWAVFTMMCCLWWRYKKIELWEIAIIVWTFISALTSIRHTPLFMIAAVPILSRQISYLYIESASFGKDNIHRFWQFFNILVAISGIIFLTDYSIVLRERLTGYRPDMFYPIQAVEYLKQNVCPGRMLSKYEWGGYLEWQIPDQKVFIDGRMASFKFNAPPGQSSQIYEDYLKMLKDKKYFFKMIDAYSVQSVLWSSSTYTRDSVFSDSINYLLKKYHLIKDTGVAVGDPATWLESAKWKKVYTDDVGVVYCRT